MKNIGHLALLDVLGFSDLIRSDIDGEKIQEYLNCLNKTILTNEVEFVAFSDSIVLTSKPNDPNSFIKIARACSNIMASLLCEGIAVRGAIAHGKFIRSGVAESVFVAGRAVIEAYQFELAQDWVGIMISPSALASVPELENNTRFGDGYVQGPLLKDLLKRLEWPAYVQRCYSIPFHAKSEFESNDFNGFAIVPTIGALTTREIANSLKLSLDKLNWLKLVSPTPSAQKKYERAIKWLEPIRLYWSRAAHSEDLEKVESDKATV